MAILVVHTHIMQRCTKLFLIHMLECSTSYLISPLIHCHDKYFARVWVVPKQSMNLLATPLFGLHDDTARYSHLCPPLCSTRFFSVQRTLLKQDNISSIFFLCTSNSDSSVFQCQPVLRCPKSGRCMRYVQSLALKINWISSSIYLP